MTTPPAEPDPTVPPPPAPPPVAPVPRRARSWPAALAAGVVAAGLTWGAGEASLGRFQPTPTGDIAQGPLAGFISFDEVHRAEARNAALAYGFQGAILGLLLGLAGAAGRRSTRAAVLAGLTGLAVGCAAGAGGSLGAFGLLLSWKIKSDPGDVLPSLLAHAAVWSLVGAAAGLAYGVGLGGRGRVARAVVGGLVGAALGAAAYEVIGTILLPLDKTGEPVADSATARFLAHALIDLCTALGASTVARAAAEAPTPAAPALG